MTRIHDREVEHRDDTDNVVTDETYDKFGGTNVGAGVFGWLVATAVAVLLTSIVGAVAAAIGDSQNITQSDAERQAGTVGLVSAAVLLAVLLIGYYAGGYVAGRMSRFDGGRQGVLVWIIGVLVTALAVALGWAFGAKYNLLDRVDLPRIPIPHDQLTLGGVVAGIAVLVGTLLAAVAGGKVGRHYHDRVDRYAER
jgi:MFS family permease